MHLLGARQARLIDHIESRRAITGIGWLDEMALHGLRRDAGLGEPVRRARGGGEPFDAVGLPDAARDPRHHVQHESPGELLRQCRDGGILFDREE